MGPKCCFGSPQNLLTRQSKHLKVDRFKREHKNTVDVQNGEIPDACVSSPLTGVQSELRTTRNPGDLFRLKNKSKVGFVPEVQQGDTDGASSC